MLKIFRTAICLTYVSFFLTSNSFAGQSDFILRLFTPEKIEWYHKVYPILSETDQNDLLTAKKTLLTFLQSFSDRDTKKSPLDYLENNLRLKYKDKPTLYMKEFGAELLKEFEIYDFKINKSNNEIIFYVFLTQTTEGEDQTTKKAFGLKKHADGWKISRFTSDIN